MSNRRIKVLASALIVLSAGSYSQASPVNDPANSTISFPARSNPDRENQSAETDEDSDESLDDLICLRGTSNLSSLVSPPGLCEGHSALVAPPQRKTSATLASQHILLRL